MSVNANEQLGNGSNEDYPYFLELAPELCSMQIVLLDSSEAASSLQASLRTAGLHNLRSFDTSDKLFKQLSELSPDLFILRLNGDGYSDFRTMVSIKKELDDEHLPFIFISSHRSLDTKQLVFQHGGLGHFTEPFETADLCLRLTNVLETRWHYRNAFKETKQLKQRLGTGTALVQVQLESLERLAQVIASNPVFQNHPHKHVANLAGQLALALGLDSDYAKHLSVAARLYDIGNIALPPDLLLKTDSLNPQEIEVLRTHTTLGAKLLSGGKSSVLRLAETIALTHHERWDGQGYPQGLQATAIPLAGRLVAVADRFYGSSLTAKGLSIISVKEGIETVKMRINTHFDPDIVAALIRLFDKGVLTSVTTKAGDKHNAFSDDL